MNNLKNKAGFTLVELIVVIAILAILAGVAIPAYSGYMTKAKEAGDTQLVSAANTAIAAACTENGVAQSAASTYLKITGADTDGKAGDTITFEANKDGDENADKVADAVFADFKFYHNNSATITFEYYDGASIGTNGNLSVTEPTA